MLRQRWMPIGLVALALVAINAAGRLIVWLAGIKGDNQLLLASLYSMLAMAVVAGYAGFRWARRYDTARTVGEVGLALLVGSLATVLLGPLVVGLSPFAGGFSVLARLFGLCLAIVVLGAGIGALLVLALGQDRKGRAWKYQADYFSRKPHKTVRR